MITEAPVLRYHDEKQKTKVSAGASESGVGAVLLQVYGNRWRPSRALSVAVTVFCNYAQIEKEALALHVRSSMFLYMAKKLIITL